LRGGGRREERRGSLAVYLVNNLSKLVTSLSILQVTTSSSGDELLSSDSVTGSARGRYTVLQNLRKNRIKVESSNIALRISSNIKTMIYHKRHLIQRIKDDA
jgi:hypothetical protein